MSDNTQDELSVLRTLIDGVRGMGIGDPDSCERVEASDIIRWAVEEIERLRGRETLLLDGGDRLESQLIAVAKQRDAATLTDAERDAILRLSPSGDPLAARMVLLTPDDRRVFHGLLERLQ